ncbi:MAG: hypothetical protein ACREV6_04625 [Clostridium sp.]|uniref:hypothetical protein n=1 Tax=Clostridium sp. TaxID=1506 RepID=UPI003D6D652E
MLSYDSILLAHNNILILLKNPENMLDILNNNLGVLSCSKEKQLREKIALLLSENAVTELEHNIVESIKSRNDIFSGFKYFDYEKFKSLAMFKNIVDNIRFFKGSRFELTPVK